MRLHTTLAGALISATAALESVPADAFRSVARGRVAVVDDFLARDVVAALRGDAEELWDAGLYSVATGVLRRPFSYPVTTAPCDHFRTPPTRRRRDPRNTQAPTRDTKLKRRNERFVLRGSVWRDFGIGRGTARSRVAATMDKVRDACAARLGRADLQRTPPARHEFSYTRFAPGASLARHVDEHHEETKGTEGWRAPTRRSVTWLVYLNERDVAGGRLRAYERRRPIAGDAQVGATADGDLQVGWLRASAADPVERPVFLASRLHDKEGNCALRVGDAVVSRPFHASPTLYVNADFVLQSLFLDASLAKRFQRLEELRTPLNPDPPIQGEYESRDVAPLAGRLVMYDSVAVPHEVLAVEGDAPRFALAGWFHEGQQAMHEPVGGVRESY